MNYLDHGLSICIVITLLKLVDYFDECVDKPGSIPLSQTGSALARADLSPFARSTLGLNRHSPAIFIKIYNAITACMA